MENGKHSGILKVNDSLNGNKYQQISVQKLATSTVDNRYLLQCNGLYYETSYSVAELVLMLQKYSEEKNVYLPL